ncbi:MAG TPA: molybdopterin cofactor-binding domain-containing protein, partial [Stellaceae bacterium]|nr:molybdopterin cofactor-binding domain-containing protein [Stellaceae bacterium]
MTQSLLTRRDLLKGSALIVGFTWAGLVPSFATKSVAPDEVDAFLAIDESGMVTVFSGKVDLGTGVRTALTQIVAEELDLPMERVNVIEGDTELTPDQGPTYGSLSIQNGGMQLRQAAATLKAALAQGGGKGVALKLDKNAPTKNPADFKLVGKSVARLDIPAKIAGQFTYMQDVRVPGMVHGRVVRPPAIGARLEHVDESSVSARVVREGNFLGVVADTEWNAIKAMRQIKATWSAAALLPEQAKLWEYVRGTVVAKDDVTSTVGDAPSGLAQGARTLKATYDFTIHTHGSIGPSCAIAEFKDGKLTCWTASQATHNLRKQLAAMLKIPDADVRAIYVEGAGCYGRNGHEDAAADAALLARAVGQPVRVQWMREDEHGWDPKGPPTLIDLEAALDPSG